MKKLLLLFLFSLSPLLLAQNFDGVEIQTLKVRDNIYMLVGQGGNITVQTGNDGILIIDTQYAELSGKILTAIRELSDGPIRHIINTHHHGDHVGGNANLKAAGFTAVGGNVGGDLGDAGEGARILAHENVLLNMAQDSDVDPEVWPTLTYFTEKKDFWFND